MNENNITNDLALNAYSVVEKSGVAIQILSVAPTSIELSYSTIDGNKPGEYGNYLAIWQSKAPFPGARALTRSRPSLILSSPPEPSPLTTWS